MLDIFEDKISADSLTYILDLNIHILAILVIFISMQYSNMRLVRQAVVTSELTLHSYMDPFEKKDFTSMLVTLLCAGGASPLSHTVSINQMNMTMKNPRHTFPLLQFTERTPRQVAMM